MTYNGIMDEVERAAGTKWAMFGFIAWCGIMPKFSVDVANYGISVATAFLLFLTIGPGRRDRRAVHAKLDDLECAVDTANSDNARLEDKEEREIEEARSRPINLDDGQGGS